MYSNRFEVVRDEYYKITSRLMNSYKRVLLLLFKCNVICIIVLEKKLCLIIVVIKYASLCEFLRRKHAHFKLRLKCKEQRGRVPHSNIVH